MPAFLSKPHKSYDEQVALLRSRGMIIDDTDSAKDVLCKFNYYRLSGYWFSFYDQDIQKFNSDVSLDSILDLYHFDARLRQWLFIELSDLEVVIRALVGYELGKIHPHIHLSVDHLGALANRVAKSRKNTKQLTNYEIWYDRYTNAIQSSHEDFVQHHLQHYNGKLPIWVAVEIMDWGMLSYLFSMAPEKTRKNVGQHCKLNAPQLQSWLKSLNIVRNLAAHHARVYNKVFDIKPKLPSDEPWNIVNEKKNKTFAAVMMILHLKKVLNLSFHTDIATLINSYPRDSKALEHTTGFPPNWKDLITKLHSF